MTAHISKNSYRPDIDGLRAIAVLTVVVFHIDESWLPGGFVGVDIFFVISGFLITSNIQKKIDKSDFRFSEFFNNRVRRIFPAAAATTILTLLVGLMILLPEDLISVTEFALSTLTSTANFYAAFFMDHSYFAEEAALSPLLHMWSLGVEEQFYLFWPLLLIAMSTRLRFRYTAAIILCLIAASFLYAQLMLNAQPMVAYYMLPSRAGQLLLGALLALSVHNSLHEKLPKVLALPAGAIGLSAVLASSFTLNGSTAFPGFAAIPVTLGSALIILAGNLRPENPVSSLLSLKPITLIGLISYSLYLAHWPVLAFFRYLDADLGLSMKFAAAVLMLGLAILSYKYIETPFRRMSISLTRALIYFFVAPLLVALLIWVLVAQTGGVGVRYFFPVQRDQILSISEAPVASHTAAHVCQRRTLTLEDAVSPECRINSTEEPTVLLWGDSNAAHYVGALSALAEQYDFSFRNIAAGSCPPVLNDAWTFTDGNRREFCRQSIQVVEQMLPYYDVIILGGAWGSYLRRDEAFQERLDETVAAFRAEGKTVILLGRVPIIRNLDVDCTRKAVLLPMLDCSQRTVDREHTTNRENSVLRSIARERGAAYFDINDLLCDAGSCSAVLDGTLVYRDPGHLSLSGSRVVGEALRSSSEAEEVFSALANISHRNIEDAWRDPRRPPADGASHILQTLTVSGVLAQRSQEMQNIPTILSDHRPDGYDFFRVASLDSSEPTRWQIPARNHLIVKFTIANVSPDSDLPLFRINVTDGGSSENFDIMLDGGSSSLVPKGAGHSLISSLSENSETGTLTVSMTLQASGNSREARLLIYPAAAPRSHTSYSQSATGSIEILDVAIGLAD